MYKRPRAEAKPKKKKDEHNRKRDVIVNFRMSPEERAELKRVASADAVDMDKLAGLKALIELFQAVNE